MPRTIKYDSLLAALAAHDAGLILSLAEIEELIGTALSSSATNNPSYWRYRGNTLTRMLRDAGWRATLHPDRGGVEFRRIPAHEDLSTRPSRPSRLDPLLTFLASQEGNTLRVSLDQLAEILGGQLNSTARLDPAWWDGREAHARKWEALGWKAELDIRGHAVAFRRTRVDPEAG